MENKEIFTRILDKTLQEKSGRFEKELEKCRKNYSEKSTHKVRVSLRRLISALDVTETALGFVKGPQPRKQLKKTLDLFGDLRDAQVRLLEVKKLKTKHENLEPYAVYLSNREKELIAHIGKEVKKINLPRIKKEIKPAQKKIRGLPAKEFKQEKYLAEAIHFVDTLHLDLVMKSRKIDVSNIRTIHETRLSFKRFRYCVEALEPALADITPEKLQRMQHLQQAMGEINDIHGLTRDISRFSRTKAGNQTSFDTVLKELNERYKAMVAGLMENLGEIDRFWAGYAPLEEMEN